jgi:hypothetical protein
MCRPRIPRISRNLQEFLSPVRLPRMLLVKVEGCDDDADAWYENNEIIGFQGRGAQTDRGQLCAQLRIDADQRLNSDFCRGTLNRQLRGQSHAGCRCRTYQLSLPCH